MARVVESSLEHVGSVAKGDGSDGTPCTLSYPSALVQIVSFSPFYYCCLRDKSFLAQLSLEAKRFSPNPPVLVVVSMRVG